MIVFVVGLYCDLVGCYCYYFVQEWYVFLIVIGIDCVLVDFVLFGGLDYWQDGCYFDIVDYEKYVMFGQIEMEGVVGIFEFVCVIYVEGFVYFD